MQRIEEALSFYINILVTTAALGLFALILALVLIHPRPVANSDCIFYQKQIYCPQQKPTTK